MEENQPEPTTLAKLQDGLTKNFLLHAPSTTLQELLQTMEDLSALIAELSPSEQVEQKRILAGALLGATKGALLLSSPGKKNILNKNSVTMSDGKGGKIKIRRLPDGKGFQIIEQPQEEESREPGSPTPYQEIMEEEIMPPKKRKQRSSSEEEGPSKNSLD